MQSYSTYKLLLQIDNGCVAYWKKEVFHYANIEFAFGILLKKGCLMLIQCFDSRLKTFQCDVCNWKVSTKKFVHSMFDDVVT